MKSNIENELTEMEFTLVLIGCMIGIGILSLPNDVIKISKQDGWISAILGAVYPLYIVFLASYVSKSYPNEDILALSKKFFGKIFGNIFNLIFVLYFGLLTTEVASGVYNVLTIYIVPFLNKWTILMVMYCSIAYTAYQGTKTIGRLNEIIFFSTIIIFLIPLEAIKDGSILNIRPVFGSGIWNIVKGTKETIFAYAGIEIIFLIYPFLKNNTRLKACGLKSIAFCVAVYATFTIIDILYLGIDTSLLFIWPLVTITESIMVPVINSFRYIFMSLWALTMFKNICNEYFIFAHGLSEITKKVHRKIFVVLTFPFIVVISGLYGNVVKARKILSKIIPVCVGFNLFFITLIAIFVWINNKKKNSSV
ncbi:GerAB/ArcD/ProY family transporter [Clostridium lundense]|uniref:GerAB/ArcD/ProY family transporter n=1 Tax=Clostridium lundense TaxID=319475 RepID=UPI00048356A0|nr:endospore germination permease [Clostridium lundense]